MAEADDVAARELVLFTENDADLYRQQHVPIIKNLMRRRAAGEYDHDRAAKLFGYLTENAAKKYAKDYASPGDWNTVFTKATRDKAAAELRDHFEAEAGTGAYDEYIPKKYRSKESDVVGRSYWDRTTGHVLKVVAVRGDKAVLTGPFGQTMEVPLRGMGGLVREPGPGEVSVSVNRVAGTDKEDWFEVKGGPPGDDSTYLAYSPDEARSVARDREHRARQLGYRVIPVRAYSRDKNGRRESVKDHERRQLVRTDEGTEPSFEALKRRRR